MSDIAIRIENLGKRYRYGGAAPLSYNLRQDIVDWVKGLFRGNAKRHATFQEVHEKHISESPEYFWALKGINLEINRGDVIGIIGRNGAGKSTLLKILSRITPPTTGKITLNGRVASLLEVGTGFHRELTGRENIFLNGSILGMRRTEIASKLDEIIAFAEIDKFIDTPVKFYSSGMYVRLAFAVAAHLEPEILVVDEVLAVGDAAFQKKCLGKMGEVAKQGRTVLFVSHNMAAIESLCTRGICVSSGKIGMDDKPVNAIRHYVSTIAADATIPIDERHDREGSGALRFTRFYAIGSLCEPTDTIRAGDTVTLVAEYESAAGVPLSNVSVDFPFSNHLGQHMFLCWTKLTGQDFVQVEPKGEFRAIIPRFPLTPGKYTINLSCEVNGTLADWVREAAVINVIEGDFFGTGRMPPGSHAGMLVDHHWQYVDKDSKGN
jgi:lipopolysaccharide transport system ATP-binding protein